MSHAGHHSQLDKECTNCELRYKKFFTIKQWKNFRKLDSVVKIEGKEYYRDVQEILCKKYDIILVDYLTPQERRKKKAVKFLKKFSPKNINDGINKFQNGMNKFSEFMNSSQGFMGEGKDLSGLIGKKDVKDYGQLLGKQNQKQNLEGLIGKNPYHKQRKYKPKPKKKGKKQYKNNYWSKK